MGARNPHWGGQWYIPRLLDVRPTLQFSCLSVGRLRQCNRGCHCTTSDDNCSPPVHPVADEAHSRQQSSGRPIAMPNSTACVSRTRRLASTVQSSIPEGRCMELGIGFPCTLVSEPRGNTMARQQF